ncbi:molybdopterin-guanine dinucleotide biosynthesis protein B [Loktanella fryxellensis]|uniref:Molybdopterin-guanine dinucleotide biosynthesis protein B n=1 Tax=Loktanella fryxellensis TaxID=245187 RepID=A0A1H8FK92_9RHOB|nr:molybdopterin-guanine dinucleotide biosynthesis protein B [Loktanella fryxellensis]SEN31597.1 molybdopterin-guanine dinucleotide biosynthesis protein B [Loktanella fryxellensis]
MKIFGITGFKNAGKTTLMERLVQEIVARGLTVSTVKHAHHDADIDHPGKDSHRHRAAGASQVILSTPTRWALMTELRGAAEPSLATLLTQLAAVDLVLVEGYKRDPHPKIEVHRSAAGHALIAPDDPTIVAIACDTPVRTDRLQLPLDDTAAIADLILSQTGLLQTAPLQTGDLPRPQPATVPPSPAQPFDTVIAVDWSGGNDKGPTPKPDAIWTCIARAGVAETPAYHRNRQVAEGWLTATLATEQAAGRRTLAVFDLCFGYPSGFGTVLTGSDDPLALWDWFAARVTDTPTANNRFALAGQINARFPGIGPFWGNGRPHHDVDHLPRKGLDRTAHGLPEHRATDMAAKGAFSPWQLSGAGAVGSQVIMGLPMLSRLRHHFGAALSVWPFQPADTPLVLAETYFSLLPKAWLTDHPIRDAAQVSLYARALSALTQDQWTELLAIAPSSEGWVLGLGHTATLTDALARR